MLIVWILLGVVGYVLIGVVLTRLVLSRAWTPGDAEIAGFMALCWPLFGLLALFAVIGTWLGPYCVPRDWNHP